MWVIKMVWMSQQKQEKPEKSEMPDSACPGQNGRRPISTPSRLQGVWLIQILLNHANAKSLPLLGYVLSNNNEAVLLESSFFKKTFQNEEVG